MDIRDFNLKYWFIIYIAVVGLLILVTIQFLNVHQHTVVSFLDIGQGDATLIQTSEYHNILIDAGPDSSIVDRLGDEMGFFDKTIDIFILTHPHADHYGGMLDVMQKYEVRKVVLTGVVSSDPVYRTFLDKVKSSGTDIVFAQNNQDIQISPNLYLDILYPFAERSLVGQDVDNKNNTSIIARLVRRTDDGWEDLVMLTGDAEMEEEREMLLSGQDIQADVLKVGHHGSKTATSDIFLSAVGPRIAVISVGEGNKFGHPHQETIDKLSGVDVRMTVESGNMSFRP